MVFLLVAVTRNMNANAHEGNGYSIETFARLSAYSDTPHKGGSYG
jgi:hypothetical protein